MLKDYCGVFAKCSAETTGSNDNTSTFSFARH